MTTFGRRGHWRTNENGTTSWVREHVVHRDHWDLTGLKAHYGSPIYAASDFLRRNNVGHGKQGCFVAPNAKCPVCGVPVFFYANSFGSRVYFDDLGPPWPKHPCTDNPRSQITHPAWAPIVKRTKGTMQELIVAANAAGLIRQKRFGESPATDWTLLLVEEVRRAGEREDIRATVLDSLETKSVRFHCFSYRPVFAISDFVSMRGSEFSFFDQESLSAVNFRSGEKLSFDLAMPSLSAVPTAPRTQSAFATQAKVDIVGPLALFSRAKMTLADRKQFPAEETELKAYIDGLRPIIERLIAKGKRTPREFAGYLNGGGVRTYSGQLWTRHSAKYLLSFFQDYAEDARKEREAAQPHREQEIMAGIFVAGVSFEKLSSMVMPTIERLNHKGVDDSAEIAKWLNRAKIFPPKEIQWSGRAVDLLLQLHADGLKTDADVRALLDSHHQPLKSIPKPAPAAAPSPSDENSLNREEIARRLSALGRVSLS